MGVEPNSFKEMVWGRVIITTSGLLCGVERTIVTWVYLGVVMQFSKLHTRGVCELHRHRGLTNTVSDSCDTRLVRKRHSRHLKPKILKGHLQGLHRVREGDRARGDRASRRAEWSENKEL